MRNPIDIGSRPLDRIGGRNREGGITCGRSIHPYETFKLILLPLARLWDLDQQDALTLVTRARPCGTASH